MARKGYIDLQCTGCRTYKSIQIIKPSPMQYSSASLYCDKCKKHHLFSIHLKDKEIKAHLIQNEEIE